MDFLKWLYPTHSQDRQMRRVLSSYNHISDFVRRIHCHHFSLLLIRAELLERTNRFFVFVGVTIEDIVVADARLASIAL